MSANSSLNPDVVKTAIDDVFYQEHDFELMPGYVDATSPVVFNQETSDKAAEIVDIFQGGGLWDTIAEEGEITQKTPRIGGQKTFTHTKPAAAILIPSEFFDDNMHGSWEMMVRNYARNARKTRDRNAFAPFRNSITTELTYDGTTLLSDTHTNRGGFTIDNKLASALSETSLNTAITQLIELKSQDGVVGGDTPRVLLVPPALAKLAFEITESELRSGTANNDMNYYSTKYGIQVAVSEWLGAAGGGTDTQYYLLGRNHSIMRYVREGLSTKLVPPEISGNDVYKYTGKFREKVGALSFEGIVGYNV